MLGPNLLELLNQLLEAEVEFIVVGGAAAVLQGAPLTTRDLDVVYRQTEANVARLMGVLSANSARIRDPAGRHLLPSLNLLLKGKQILMVTDAGPFDCLGQLHDGRKYDDLLERSDEFDDGRLSILVLDLETLIETKVEANRPKDRMAVPILLAVLKERGGK